MLTFLPLYALFPGKVLFSVNARELLLQAAVHCSLLTDDFRICWPPVGQSFFIGRDPRCCWPSQFLGSGERVR